MISGLGVDIVEIGRMAAALDRHPGLRERLFSADERAYCDARNRPEIHYALRFAAKEAVLKALGTGFSGMRFTDVEVARDAGGRPFPRLAGRAKEVADGLGVVELHLSLSYTHTTAVASAVAITSAGDAPVPADPERRRTAAFRDAKALLDDLEPPADRPGPVRGTEE
jgi:holo-[acyl-carrier protein] synthase